ncbi:MAG: AbrB/MazE/SpoVT family DNA-binding domain-containing protein [Acidobacteria bacterium]|nr:AbrB/MazE/SpoVT family DNA-binding domain-containing protein [Acidobacteriota bacterium]
MTVQIDKAGRIVLPKPVRDQLGLEPGTSLELRVAERQVILLAPDTGPSLVQEGGFLVYSGEVPDGFEVRRAIADERAERIRRIWGA